MAELDLGAVRAFLAVAEARHFGDAAAQLGITQQAVSKRIAKLEFDLGTILLSRLRSGTGLSRDGDTFLPYARTLLEAADAAVSGLRGRHQALRVDVLDTRLAATELVRGFHESARAEVDVVTSEGLSAARSALKTWAVDAAFARVVEPFGEDVLACAPAYLEPIQVLVGPGSPLAGVDRVAMTDLAGCVAWMPGNVPGSEWAEYYEHVSAEFDIKVDTSGPVFGFEHFVTEIGGSPTRIGFVGERSRLPEHPAVRRVAISEPYPVYPWSLLWHGENRHPSLPGLISHVRAGYRPPDLRRVWLPVPDRPAFAGDRRVHGR